MTTRLLARCLHAGARRGRAGNRMVDDVWMVSEGNPFVVVESMQAIREEARDSGRFGSPLARSVQEFVAARLDRLGERARHLVGDGGRHRKGLLIRGPGPCGPGLRT